MKERRPTPRGSRFFSATAVIITLLVVLSFPLTYFVPLATGTKHFTLLRHLHGLAFFAWIALYTAQALLVRVGKVHLHRDWGLAGIWLTGTMLPLGLWQAVTSAGERQAKDAALPFEFSLYNLVDILVFSITFGWAIHEASRRIEWHRRLMLVAALSLFGPAFSRIALHLPFPFPWADMAPNLIADALLIALAIYDRRQLDRLHPVTIGAMVFLIPFHAVEPLIARSAWWTTVAPRVFGFA